MKRNTAQKMIPDEDQESPKVGVIVIQRKVRRAIKSHTVEKGVAVTQFNLKKE